MTRVSGRIHDGRPSGCRQGSSKIWWRHRFHLGQVNRQNQTNNSSGKSRARKVPPVDGSTDGGRRNRWSAFLNVAGDVRGPEDHVTPTPRLKKINNSSPVENAPSKSGEFRRNVRNGVSNFPMDNHQLKDDRRDDVWIHSIEIASPFNPDSMQVQSGFNSGFYRWQQDEFIPHFRWNYSLLG